MSKLLPPNSSAIERAVEATFNLNSSIECEIDVVKKANQTPEKFLEFLAWEASISEEEGWNLAESVTAKRALVSGSFDIHIKKGTISSIKEIFKRLGFGEIQLLENVGRLRRDGTFDYDATMIHGGDHSSTWATYNVLLLFPVTNDQAMNIRRLLDGIGPARSELVNLDFRQVAYRHNSEIIRDGIFNYGSA